MDESADMGVSIAADATAEARERDDAEQLRRDELFERTGRVA